MKDVYTWAAIYTDDTFISEYDRPEGRGFAEVDLARVKECKLESETLPSRYVEIPPGAMPIFFRRRTRIVNSNTNEQAQGATVHCIGWKREEHACYLFAFDDGSTLLTSNLQAV